MIHIMHTAGNDESSELKAIKPEIVHLERAGEQSGIDQDRLKNLSQYLYWNMVVCQISKPLWRRRSQSKCQSRRITDQFNRRPTDKNDSGSKKRQNGSCFAETIF